MGQPQLTTWLWACQAGEVKVVIASTVGMGGKPTFTPDLSAPYMLILLI
jgi:hypothetical protein